MYQRLIFCTCLILILVTPFALAVAGFRPDAGTYVKGVVTQSNKPLRSVWVIASQSGTERGRALTGDDGKYYIGYLSAGGYDMVVIQGKQQVYSGQITLPQNRIFNIAITPPPRARYRR